MKHQRWGFAKSPPLVSISIASPGCSSKMLHTGFFQAEFNKTYKSPQLFSPVRLSSWWLSELFLSIPKARTLWKKNYGVSVLWFYLQGRLGEFLFIVNCVAQVYFRGNSLISFSLLWLPIHCVICSISPDRVITQSCYHICANHRD